MRLIFVYCFDSLKILLFGARSGSPYMTRFFLLFIPFISLFAQSFYSIYISIPSNFSAVAPNKKRGSPPDPLLTPWQRRKTW